MKIHIKNLFLAMLIVFLITGSTINIRASESNASRTELNTKSETGSEELSRTVKAGPGIAVVETEAGTVQGYIRKGIYTYHGVPYAEAKERFVPAEKVEPWEGVRLAFEYGPISPQHQRTGGSGSSWENPSRQFRMDNNCQNLNVWTPGVNDNKKRPVMIWLHGGGFSSGSSAQNATFDGANLSRKGDVVVVSVNHRLNVLGHLDLSQYGDKYQYSANVGITDIVDALEWVQNNIEQFGGDPNNVTVFGESGGGAKVLALMTTPYAEGLFHKGIVQSGTTDTVGLRFNANEVSKRVTEITLDNLGIEADNIEALQTVDYEELTQQSSLALEQAAEEYEIEGPFGGFAMEWQPVVEGDYMPTNSVTDNSFAEAGRNIPLLIGTNLAEWEAFSLFQNMSESQTNNKNTWSEEKIDSRLEDKYGDKKEKVVTAFKKAYPNKTKADALYVDTMIRLPSLKIMSHKAEQSKAPVYSYMFTWESPVMNGIFISHHTAEIPFVFNNIDKADTTIGGGKDARILENKMSQAWINFARYGNPNVDELPEWPTYTRENGATMIFDNNSRVGFNHDEELLEILAPEYNY